MRSRLYIYMHIVCKDSNAIQMWRRLLAHHFCVRVSGSTDGLEVHRFIIKQWSNRCWIAGYRWL